MQIVNFDRNWLNFGRKHLCMVLQKRYLGKLLKKFFRPIFGPKKSKNGHFCSFFWQFDGFRDPKIIKILIFTKILTQQIFNTL